MAKFFLGFGVATLLWGAALGVLVGVLGWGPPQEEPEAVVAIAETEEAPVEDEEPTRRQRRRRRAGGGTEAAEERSAPTGNATTGDDLREGEMRTIDGEGSGGEAQLSGAQIDAAFDGAMPRIRRCFVLAAGDDPVTGRLTFGMRIAGSGRVSVVNLSGPAAVTAGECGECLREAARNISFPSFDGPEMVARYPITLE